MKFYGNSDPIFLNSKLIVRIQSANAKSTLNLFKTAQFRFYWTKNNSSYWQFQSIILILTPK
jgi:hypothetical protein